MKKVLLILILVLFTKPNFGQINSPSILWDTYFGGSEGDYGIKSTVDNVGNVYIIGHTSSTSNISSSGAHQQTFGGGYRDVFVAKFDSSGNLLWSTYYGGSGNEEGYGITTDANGNVFICGYTTSYSNISTSGCHQENYGGVRDAFVVKFNSNGERQWATYFGGSAGDGGMGICCDINGNIYIIGDTWSSNNIATNANHQSTIGGGQDVFIAKFNTDGVLLWSTYYGGNDNEYSENIKTDINGNVIIIGYTKSTNAIASNGSHQSVYGDGDYDAFVAKFNTNGQLLWGTYYGGNDMDYGKDIAVDISGNIYVTGWTASTNAIASSGSHQSSYSGGYDAFLVKFNPNGVRSWGTYFGGNNLDQAQGIACDAQGNIIMVGETASTNGIYTSGSLQNSLGGNNDAFITMFNSNGVRKWGTYYGKSNFEVAWDIIIDVNNKFYITGQTSSANLVQNPTHQSNYGGGTYDAFITKFQYDYTTNTVYNFKENDFQIFPNPCNNIITITSEIKRNIKLLDLNGKTIEILNISPGNNTIILSLPSNYYFLQDVKTGKCNKLIIE